MINLLQPTSLIYLTDFTGRRKVDARAVARIVRCFIITVALMGCQTTPLLANCAGEDGCHPIGSEFVGKTRETHADARELDEGLLAVTLSLPDETVVAVARSNAGMALVWREDGRLRLWWDGVVVAETAGETAALIFDHSGNLHVIYQQKGTLIYEERNGKTVSHSQLLSEQQIQGTDPQLALNQQGDVYLFYAQEGGVYERAQVDKEWGEARFMAHGEIGEIRSTESGMVAVVWQGEQALGLVRDRHGAWLTQHRFPIEHNGRVKHIGLGSDGELVTAAWVVFEATDKLASRWLRQRPIYNLTSGGKGEAYEGEHGQVVFSEDGRHLAGIYQQIPTEAGAIISASAWGREIECEGCEGIFMNGAICLDRQGGTDLLAEGVVCSASGQFLGDWGEVQVTAVSEGESVTLFLRSAPDLPRKINGVIWDGVTVTGGDLRNGSFEEGGVRTSELASSPETWRPFFIEDDFIPTGIGVYTLYLSWSADGGRTWTTPQKLLDNGERGGIGEKLFPVVDDGKLALFYVAQEGEVDWSTRAGTVRYGRPKVVVCKVADTSLACSDSVDLLGAGRSRPLVNLRVDDGGQRDSPKDVWVVWDAYQGSYAQNKDLFALGVRPWHLMEGQ